MSIEEIVVDSNSREPFDGDISEAFACFLERFALYRIIYEHWYVRHLDEFAERFVNKLKPEQYFTVEATKQFLKEVDEDWLKCADEDDRASFDLVFREERYREELEDYIKDIVEKGSVYCKRC